MKKILAALMALLMLAPLACRAESVPVMTLEPAATVEPARNNYVNVAHGAGRRIVFDMRLSDVARDFTGEPAVDQVIYDVLSSVVVSGYVQGDEVYYALSMKQDDGSVADLLTMGTALSGEDLYLLTNLIGSTVVVGKDEVVPVLERLVDMFVLMGYIPESQAESIKAEQLPALWETMQAEFAVAYATPDPYADIDVTQLNYDALLGVVQMVAGKLVKSDVAQAPQGCDAAVEMYTLTVTPEEMNEILVAALQFIKDNPAFADAVAKEMDFDNTAAIYYSSVAGEPIDFMTFLDMAMEAIPGAEPLLAEDMVCHIWLGEDGMPVAADVAVTLADSGETIGLTLTYSRLTVDGVTNHGFVLNVPGGSMTLDVTLNGKTTTVRFGVAEEGENQLMMTLEYTDRSAENLLASDLLLDLTLIGATVNMNAYYYVGDVNEDYSVSEKVDEINIRLTGTTDTVFSDADFTETVVLTVAVDGKEYATVDLTIASTEPGESIMAGDVSRLAALSDSDFASWFIGAYNTFYTWSSTVLLAMPDSLINLLVTGY